MRRILGIALTTLVSASPLAAQRLGPVEKRPTLETADTNSFQAYYDRGLAALEKDPETAAAAFYWAARLNPRSGEALYGRRVALIMEDPRLLRKVMEGNRQTLESKEVRRLDSLQFRALMLSPFLFRKLDRTMYVNYVRKSVMDNSRQQGGGEQSQAEVDHMIDTWLARADDATRAWIAYSDADFPRALNFYAQAIGSARDKASVRMDRARIFAMLNQSDSAVAELNLAITEMQNKDKKDLVVFYNSKALGHYTIGHLFEANNNAAGAKESYGRALQEDLAYYPAHVSLGMLALASNDTTSAMSELALAAQLAPDEPYIRYSNAYALAAAQHYAEAATETEKAIELEPQFALPYLLAAKVAEKTGKAESAAKRYQEFLDHSAADDPQRQLATTRLAYVKKYLAGDS